VRATVARGPLIVGPGPLFAAGPLVAEAYRAPRTASGQPDLRGVWTNATLGASVNIEAKR